MVTPRLSLAGMSSFRSQFIFSRAQRNGILGLVFVIVGLLTFYFFLNTSEEPPLQLSNKKISEILAELDSLRCAELEARKPKQFPFNPNFLTDYKAYTLGMSTEEYDRLQEYREAGKWINSAADFKRVTRVSDSLLKAIRPLFKFPEWITNPKPFIPAFRQQLTELPPEKRTDLNTASETELQKVRGIGPALSRRIVKYRERIGGFSNDRQLYEVYGLNDSVIKQTLKLFTVAIPKKIEKININTASASDIATIPGVSFELGKRIWEFRILREKIDDISELEKIEGMTHQKLQLFQLYLSIE
jgi:competence protein ComEA